MLTNKLFLLILTLCFEKSFGISYNNRPIIGILAQEFDDELREYYPDPKYNSYIAASYVKYVESSGAQVVPIFIGQDDSYYDKITNYLNGMLFPGGDAPFDMDGKGYAGAAKKLYNLAIKKNLPLWGTCLGFEVIAIIAAGRNILNVCKVNKESMPLQFTENYKNSAIYGNAPVEIIDILSNNDVTWNNHDYCLTRQNMTKSNMLEEWKILNVNGLDSGMEFISTIESSKYPIWGVQFHPEKNNFEWFKRNFTHSDNAIQISQYFGNFFVNATRNNFNKFPTETEEINSLIYNYQTTFTGKNLAYTECYFFE